jgi:hypothetical protein
LRVLRTDNAADIRLDAMSENCVFYISPMYEFSHSLDPKRTLMSARSRAPRGGCRRCGRSPTSIGDPAAQPATGICGAFGAWLTFYAMNAKRSLQLWSPSRLKK